MQILSIPGAGLMATFIMTIFMNCCARFTGRNLYTVGILSAMLPPLFGLAWSAQSNKSKLFALLVHYGIGVIFAAVYYLFNVFNRTQAHGVLYEAIWVGVMYGVIAVTGWAVFVRIHPAPLTSVPWPLYLVCIFIAHIVFSIAMVYTYWAINDT